MILPIKIYTTEESFLVVRLCIPIWFSIRKGFKPHTTVKDRWFAPNMTCSTGVEKECLHAYILGFNFRIRSNFTMRLLKKDAKRFLFAFHKGWGQVFTSGII